MMNFWNARAGQAVLKAVGLVAAIGTMGLSATAEAVCTPAGTFQDNTGYSPDVDFTYTGNWAHSSAFPNALYGTLSWTKDVPNNPWLPDLAVSFALECRTAFDYFYTSTFNRGHAGIVAYNPRTGEVRSIGFVDQYSPTTQYARSVRINIPWTERTIIYIAANGTKNAASTDTYIDIDGIVPR